MSTILDFFYHWLNPLLWPAASLLLAYLTVVLIGVVGFYSFFMNWKKYEVGRRSRELYIALMVLTALSAYRIFFGTTSWLFIPEGIEWWRPTLQVAIYGYVCVTMTRILMLMVSRWRTGAPLQVAVSPKPRERDRVQTGPTAVVPPGD